MNESGGGERTGTRPGGIASAAVTALTTWAFAQLPLHRIELCHAVANRASCRVAARAGYPAESTPRESYRYGDGRLRRAPTRPVGHRRLTPPRLGSRRG